MGGVRHLDTDVAEVKSMYVAPAYRGTGLGQGGCSTELEGIAASTAAAPSASTPPTT